MELRLGQSEPQLAHPISHLYLPRRSCQGSLRSRGQSELSTLSRPQSPGLKEQQETGISRRKRTFIPYLREEGERAQARESKSIARDKETADGSSTRHCPWAPGGAGGTTFGVGAGPFRLQVVQSGRRTSGQGDGKKKTKQAQVIGQEFISSPPLHWPISPLQFLP